MPSVIERQGDGKDRAACQSIGDVDPPLVVGDDPVNDGESQPGACRLGGEKRAEDVPKNLRRDALAAVAYNHHHSRGPINVGRTDRYLYLSTTIY